MTPGGQPLRWLALDGCGRACYTRIYMKLSVLITTYQRRQYLLRLLQQLADNDSSGLDVSVHILHDGPLTFDYIPVNAWLKNHQGWTSAYMPSHCGRVLYYRVINQLLTHVQRCPADYYIKLDDDVHVGTTFFKDAIKAYRSVSNPRCVCLNLTNDGRGRPGWVLGLPPARRTAPSCGAGTHSAQWTDMCGFIATEQFFKCVAYRLHCPFPPGVRVAAASSSGVGKQISRRVVKSGYDIYQVDVSLVTHDDHTSVMHPRHRREVPLITNNITCLQQVK